MFMYKNAKMTCVNLAGLCSRTLTISTKVDLPILHDLLARERGFGGRPHARVGRRPHGRRRHSCRGGDSAPTDDSDSHSGQRSSGGSLHHRYQCHRRIRVNHRRRAGPAGAAVYPGRVGPPAERAVLQRRHEPHWGRHSNGPAEPGCRGHPRGGLG